MPVQARKASPFQVAATMFCGIFAIGATVTFAQQFVIGAAVIPAVPVPVLVLSALVGWAVR